MTDEWLSGAVLALNDAVENLAQPGGGVPADLLLRVAQTHALVAVAFGIQRLGDLIESIPEESEPEPVEEIR